MYRRAIQIVTITKRSCKFCLAMICLLNSLSNEMAMAQGRANQAKEINIARPHRGIDKDFTEGSEYFRQRYYEKAASSFRKSLEVRNHASGHIALGEALLGTAQSSDNPQTQPLFLEAISQFEFYPLALKEFRNASTAYLSYLRSHKKNKEATRFEKLYKQRLAMLTADADGLHSSQGVYLDKYKTMKSITGLSR